GNVEIRVVGDRDVQVDPGPNPGQVARHGDLSVRNGVDRAIEVAQQGAPQAEILHDPLDARDAHDVALVVLVFEDHEDPGQPVANQGLGAESNGNAHDAEPRDGRTDVDVESGAQRHQDGHDHDHHAA